MNRENLYPYLRRLAIAFVLSLVGAFLVSEIAFRLQPNNVDRAPQAIELVIPPGTADAVARGEAVPTIPEELVFVLGDVLTVVNQDTVTHELGPLLIPAGTSASMPMDHADNIAVSCSFRPSAYLGLEVKEPTTLKTRLLGLSFAVPPTTLMVFLYSLAARPIAPRRDGDE
ncbi:MAG: hypothetical protein HYZ26_10315 [Chloroflexi bacterium]|nr:hypothetical protein [Chloroflexota bacterium]